VARMESLGSGGAPSERKLIIFYLWKRMVVGGDELRKMVSGQRETFP
jgi:hypothetical protein